MWETADGGTAAALSEMSSVGAAAAGRIIDCPMTCPCGGVAIAGGRFAPLLSPPPWPAGGCMGWGGGAGGRAAETAAMEAGGTEAGGTAAGELSAPGLNPPIAPAAAAAAGVLRTLAPGLNPTEGGARATAAAGGAVSVAAAAGDGIACTGCGAAAGREKGAAAAGCCCCCCGGGGITDGIGPVGSEAGAAG